MGGFVIKSFAKLNLGLVIKGKREDGYHNIETLFQEISLYDDVSVELSDNPGVEMVCNLASLPCDDSNLMVMAANRLLEISGTDKGVFLSLNKRIPIGAGLGGGSGNAALVLVELNRLLGLGLSISELKEIAVGLGSDVPFFIAGGGCFAEGVGEKLVSVDIPAFWAILVCPDIHISTAGVYGDTRLLLTSRSNCIRVTLLCARRGDLAALARSLVNDLEYVVFSKHTEIPVIKSALLNNGALGALMSGSGSTVFGMFRSRAEAHTALLSFCRLNIVQSARLFIVSSDVEEGYSEYSIDGQFVTD